MRANFSDQDIKELINAGIQEGRPAKGLKQRDGSFIYWEVDGLGYPHHNEILQHVLKNPAMNEGYGIIGYLFIDRKGNVEDYNYNDNWQFG
jgi:hypothetical protein